MTLSEFAYQPPPPPLPEKGKKIVKISPFFFGIIFVYNSTASKRAFCLEYPFGTIFCFKAASLALEIIIK